MTIIQQVDSRLIRATTEHAQKMYDSSLSRNTRINYRSRLNKFLEAGYKFPASPRDIVKFIVDLSHKVNPRTIDGYVKAIRFVHKINDFIDPTTDPTVVRIMSGIKRSYGKPLKKAKALTFEDMKKIQEYLLPKTDPSSIRNLALLLVGFYGAFRRSELVSLRLDNLEFSEEGVKIFLAKSKTDQNGNGQYILIPKVKELCAITALERWIKAARLKNTMHLWPHVSHINILHGSAIKAENLCLIVKNIVKKCGLEDPDAYSAHSLRRGFATEIIKRGANIHQLMKQGRWKSVQVAQGYIDDTITFEDNAINLFATPQQ